MKNDIKEMFSGLGASASQAQSRYAEEQKRVYKDGPWWNFLQFISVPGDESNMVFSIKKAMQMQCLMYGNCYRVKKYDNLFIKPEQIESMNLGGRMGIVFDDDDYVYIFPRAIVRVWRFGTDVITSEEGIYKALNEKIEALNEQVETD